MWCYPICSRLTLAQLFSSRVQTLRLWPCFIVSIIVICFIYMCECLCVCVCCIYVSRELIYVMFYVPYNWLPVQKYDKDKLITIDIYACVYTNTRLQIIDSGLHCPTFRFSSSSFRFVNVKLNKLSIKIVHYASRLID